MNPYAINPSFAGTDGKASMALTYRKQWVDIEGAPAISNFSFHIPTGKKLGFGINFTNARRSLFNTTSGYITSSYGISLTPDAKVRFGLSGGIAYNGVDVAEIENIADPELQSLLDNNIYAVANAGVSVQFKTLNFGLSIPNLFTDQYTSGEEFGVGEVKPFENALLFLTNRFYFADNKHVFEPYLLYRYSNILPTQFEASAVVHLNHVVWLGGSYKQDFGISAFGGVKLQKFFGIGYAYSLKKTGINEINSPTHEIQLHLLLGVRDKNRPYYSFVDTEMPKGKTKRQLALEQRREEAARRRKEEKAKAEEEKKAREEEELKVEEKRLAEQKRMEQEKLAEEKAREERERQAAREKESKEEPVDNDKNLVEEHYTDERVIVKRGSHLLELEQGEYVMVGVFNDYEHAEEYSDELFFKGYQTRFGYITASGQWYVYILKTDSAQKAMQERDKYRKIGIFSKAWVISVQ